MRPSRTFVRTLILSLFAILCVVSSSAQATWWVQSADYGWNNQRQDVTNTVRRLVNGPNFRVNNNSMGIDPARGKDKTLRIVARDAGGRSRDFTYKEGSTVNSQMFAGGPNSGRPGWGNGPGYGKPGYDNNYMLTITNARWGAGSRWQDVTQRLQRMVRNNRLSVTVTPQTMGGDPIHGTSKTLNVTYQYQGRRNSKTVPEGGLLNLP